MVQIANALIIATLIAAPVLAAPARKAQTHGHKGQQAKHHHSMRKGLRVGGQVGGGALTAASTAAGVAALVPQQAREFDEEPEVREPKARTRAARTGGQKTHHSKRKGLRVGGKVAGGVLTAVSTAAGIAGIASQQQARDFDEELEVREPKARTRTTRTGGQKTRQSKRKGLRNVGKAAGGALTAGSAAAGIAGIVSQQQARDFDDELEVREPKARTRTTRTGGQKTRHSKRKGLRNVGKVAGGALTAGSTAAGIAGIVSQQQAREFNDDLEVREPRAKARAARTGGQKTRHSKRKGLRVAGTVAGGALTAGSTAAGIAGIVSQQQARDFDEELEVREPRARARAQAGGRKRHALRKSLHVAGGVLGAGTAAAGIATAVPQSPQQAREFEDEFEIEAREPQLSGIGQSPSASHPRELSRLWFQNNAC